MEGGIIIKPIQHKLLTILIISIFVSPFSNTAFAKESPESGGFSGGISGFVPLRDLIIQMNAQQKQPSGKLSKNSVVGFSGGISGYVPLRDLIIQMNLAKECTK